MILGARDGVCRKCPGAKSRSETSPIIEENQMAKSSDDIPEIEEPDPLDPEDAADVAPLDSEIDFDDEQEEDQVPLDETEAAEAGVLLDDPEALSDDDE